MFSFFGFQVFEVNGGGNQVAAVTQKNTAISDCPYLFPDFHAINTVSTLSKCPKEKKLDNLVLFEVHKAHKPGN